MAQPASRKKDSAPCPPPTVPAAAAWSCHTPDAYALKILVELLQMSAKIVCITVHGDKLPPEARMRFTDAKGTMLYDVALDGMVWQLAAAARQPFHIGVNIRHLFRMIKSTKKKDSLALYQIPAAPEYLSVAVASTGRMSVVSIKVHHSQLTEIDIPEPNVYTHGVHVLASELQKTMKDLTSNGGQLTARIVPTKGHGEHVLRLEITANMDGVFSKSVMFEGAAGGPPSGDKGIPDPSRQVPEAGVEAAFDCGPLQHILKIASLNKLAYIGMGHGLPLWIRIAVGTAGWLNVYIRMRDYSVVEPSSAAAASPPGKAPRHSAIAAAGPAEPSAPHATSESEAEEDEEEDA